MMTTKQAGEFGCNVWWTMPETSVDGIRAQTIMAKHGFEPTDVKIPTRQAEVSRAVQSFHNRRSKNDRRLGEKVKETMDEAIYGILDREQEGEEVAFEQHTTVKLDKDTGNVEVQGNLKDAFKKALAEFEGKITDTDLRTFLRKVIRMCYGVAKRPTGGIYFVPAKYAGVIDQAQAVLAEFNTAARIYVERVMDGVQERQNVWESVESDVEKRLAEATAAVGRIGRRVSAVKARGEDVNAARELMEVYRGLLGEEARYESLAEKIEEAVRVVTDKMEEITPAATMKDPNAPKAPRVKTGVTVADATVKILTEAGKVLSAREIADEAIKQGLYSTTAASPYNSFNATLHRAIKLGEARVRRVGRGVYELAA